LGGAVDSAASPRLRIGYMGYQLAERADVWRGFEAIAIIGHLFGCFHEIVLHARVGLLKLRAERALGLERAGAGQRSGDHDHSLSIHSVLSCRGLRYCITLRCVATGAPAAGR